MSDIYHDGNRQLQDEFDTRRLADRLDEAIVQDSILPSDKDFIERLDMFFIATVDERGHANCSYKAGEPGFVRVLDEHTLAFPNYDGNGMYLSMGNILKTRQVGMLFIDFENQKRMRLNGEATLQPGRRAHAGIPRSAVHRARAGARGVRQLPALHPQDETGAALALRAKTGMLHPRAGLEKRRMGRRQPAGQ